MTYLVTGATGLLGTHVVRLLSERGERVRAGVHRTPTGAGADQPPVETAAIDVSDQAGLAAAMAGVDTVLHCAAVYSYDRGSDVHRINVEGTRNVVEAAAAAGVRRVVVTSSSVTCGSSAGPQQRDEGGAIATEYVPPYFASKVEQEHTAFTAGCRTGVEVVIACPTVVLGGPTRRLVPSNAIVLRYLMDPWHSTYPGGCNLVAVEDVARGHLLLADGGVAGRRYLLGGENLTWPAVHELIAELTGVPGPGWTMATTAAYLAAGTAEAWGRLTGSEPLSFRDEALTVGRYYWYTSARAEVLGYSAGPARHAVATAVNWLLAERRVPDWVRSWLHLHPDVRRARPLVPRPL